MITRREELAKVSHGFRTAFSEIHGALLDEESAGGQARRLAREGRSSPEKRRTAQRGRRRHFRVMHGGVSHVDTFGPEAESEN